MKNSFKILIVLVLSAISTVFAYESAATAQPDASVYFISPQDNQTIQKKFKVQFGLSGMGIAPAGVKKENTGHHHLLIDTDIESIDLTKPLPATDKIKHFGDGQTETTLTLAPGKHTLQLLLGNYLHIPHHKTVVSKKMTITIN